MATDYQVVFDKALSKMREYAYLDMDDDEIFYVMKSYLKSAEADFARICVEPLNDVSENGYNADLSNESIEILALGIVCHWSTSYVADADKLRIALGTKDYSITSPANSLNSVRDFRENLLMEYHDKINRYSFLYGNVLRKSEG